MGEIEAREEMLTEKDPDLQEIEADVITILDSVTLNDAIEQGKQLEPLKALVYPYFWEEELVLFFADNGVGKSILATQIAQYIAEGKGGESLEVQTEAQKVLYFDFELNIRQIIKRYGDFHFSDNVQRVTIKRGTEPEYISQLILPSIESEIAEKKAKVCIIDNISWLSTQTTDPEAAKILMGGLHRIVRDSHAAILAIAHCPKVEEYQPINKNMLGGAKALSDFADGVFAMGRNRQGVRYIKLLKTRMLQEQTQDSMLPTFEIVNEPYLRLRYLCDETESRILFRQKRQDFFSKLWGEDKERGISLKDLAAMIVEEDNSNSKNKDHKARNRIDAAVKKGVLRKEDKIIYLND